MYSRWRLGPPGQEATDHVDAPSTGIKTTPSADGTADPDLVIVHNSFFHTLICRLHQTTVDNPAVHLRSHHPELSLQRRRQIIAAHSKAVVVKTAEIKLPQTPIAPVPELAPPISALRCTEADCFFLCVNEDHMQNHAYRDHRWRKSERLTKPWEPVLAQVLALRGRFRIYFPVRDEAQSCVLNLAEVDSSVLTNRVGPHRETEDEDEDEAQRLLLIQDNSPALDVELDYNHDSDWLRGCGWPKWFGSKPLVVITSATVLPSNLPTSDRVLGYWHGVQCVSPVEDERCLSYIVAATNRVLQRCEETVRETPRLFRCWLRSWGPAFVAFPFELPKRETSRQRYHSYWRKLICYLFRAFRVCQRLKERTQDIFGHCLSPLQQQTIVYLWRESSQLTSSAGCSPPVDQFPAPLLEHLFQFFVILWTGSTQNGPIEHHPIVHFAGVLGVHPYDLVYRRAYDYTPYLAALIWLGRLIILEYALPLSPYHHLPHVWPARSAYPDQMARLREDIRPRFLQRGSPSPVGYLIERLQHGRAIARREGSKAQISWSDDGQLLRVDQSEIRMSQFRAIVHGAIVRAHQQTQDLLCGWWPTFDLSQVHDDLVCARPGFSFLQHPANKLQYGFRLLKHHVFVETKTLAWSGVGRQKALQYLQACDRLVALLYGSVHMTSGMPARCEELRTICWANTTTALRNVFIHKGQVILVFAYNKAVTHHNNSFYVVRTPCPMVQQLLFVYLTYIRPFRDHLSRQLRVTSFAQSNSHVFTLHQEAAACFSAARSLRSLRLSASDTPLLLNTAIYRQIAVSIAKRHLPQLIQPFDAHLPQDQSGILKLLAFQTGHRPQTQAHSYAIDRDYPSRLQPHLIERYDINSRLWHEFNMIRAEDVIDANVDNETLELSHAPTAPSYSPTKHTPQESSRESSSYQGSGTDTSEDQINSGVDQEDSAREDSDQEDSFSEESNPIVVHRAVRRTILSHKSSDRGKDSPGVTWTRPTKKITTRQRPPKRSREAFSESPDSKRIKSIQVELEQILAARRRRRR